MEIPNFSKMVCEAQTLEGAQKEFAAINRAFDDAATTAQRVEVIDSWVKWRDRRGTWSSIVGLHFNQDTENKEYLKARDYRDELSPKLTDLEVAFKKKLLAHPDRDALVANYGPQAFALWEADARAFDPCIEDDLVKESKLTAEYVELLSAARFEFRGESLNLSSLGKYFVDADRDTREESSRLRWEWFDAQREQLDRIFDDLVKLRAGMARKLGLKDFIELGYLKMHRIDYTREDVERFRAQIRDEIVPLCSRIREQQAKTLGVETLMHWDEGVHDKNGNPKPQGDHDWMIRRALEMFDGVGSGLGEFFRLMVDHDLLDLKSRNGKAGGGFCTSMPIYGTPFVFANFNGTDGDVRVFTHEMGHAFQCYSSRNQPLNDYYWPTMESCEVHSMSLEFLTWPWMEKFFEHDADRFRRLHLTQAILFLPYGTAVDHFQHLIYETPDATPAQRHAMWAEMERTYLPWRNFGDMPHAKDGAFWQVQRHIYRMPFYYIDYVLAQICALQFWVRADNDREAAMKDYVTLCGRGGEAPFQQLVTDAGLRSPFEPGCLSAVVKKASDWLGV